MSSGDIGNLEKTFNEMNKFINIDRDREKFTKYFNQLRDQLFCVLKKSNEILAKCLKGYHLEGSYGDNLKVNIPDEFDLVFFLKFPENDRIIVRKDNQIPGNVFLDLSNLFDNIKDKPHLSNVYNFLQKMVTKNNLMIVDKLQSWLQSLVSRALNEMGNQYVVDGIKFNLSYANCGPAHTITVSGGNYRFSVDFVPAIKLIPAQSVLNGNLKNNYDWEAIPKPIKPFKKDNTSFRASYYTAEYNLLKNNYNLKSALRFMKKFRDCHPNMSNLKSYYIKTMFLLKLNEKGVSSDFWNQPLNIVVFEMFSSLEGYLHKERLPFYWDPNLNMLNQYDSKKIHEMFCCVVNARKILIHATKNFSTPYKYKVQCLFLKSEELRKEKIVNPFTNVNGSDPKSSSMLTSTQTTQTTQTNCILM